jgi:hypothetical protein
MGLKERLFCGIIITKRIDTSVRRDTAMDDIKNVLYSLIPLILIILFSWLFGLLGSKMKKPTDEEDVSLKRGSEDQPFDILSAIREAAGQRPEPQGPEPQGALKISDRTATPIERGVWGTGRGSGGPVVTPKPITPKWWGA